MSQFTPTPKQFQGLRIAKMLPVGKAWDAANDSDTNMGKLFKGLGGEFYRLELLIQTLNRELDINRTEQLIRDWETAVGIPDDCFTIQDETLAKRRSQVLVKLRNIRIQSRQDFIDLAAEFGVEVDVTPGVLDEFGKSDKEIAFSMIVDIAGETSGEVFPFDVNFFPIPFVSQINSFIVCLFNKVKPANVNIDFRFGFNTILNPKVQAIATVSVGSIGVFFDDESGLFDDAPGLFDEA